MDTHVIYSTEAFLHKNKGQIGTQLEKNFSSIEEAKSAPLPAGHTFALIRVAEGSHVYDRKTGWTFHLNET